MVKAIFLDRDGVLNREIGDYICSLKDFYILDYNIEFLKILQQKGYIFIVVTNQGGIALNRLSEHRLLSIHNFMQQEYLKHGIVFSEIYYCPHHPKVSQCLCRKPGSLLFEQAISKFGISVKSSYMIGDNDRDIIAAENVGIKGIKVDSNQKLEPLIKSIR